MVDWPILSPESGDSPRTASTGQRPLEKKGGNNMVLATQKRSSLKPCWESQTTNLETDNKANSLNEPSRTREANGPPGQCYLLRARRDGRHADTGWKDGAE